MTTDVHLLVLVHGMWGNPGHLDEMRRKIRMKWSETRSSLPTEFYALLATTNVDNYTYDGVDHGGERVADEIVQEVEKFKEMGRVVTKFSITGYSLGGLVSRYVIGVLHQRKFFDNVTPVNFNTFATPHIGLPRYPNFFSALANSLGPKLLSRTGEQFFAVDKWSPSGRSLLSVMADPDRVFYQALELFPNKTIYANAINDITVPYVTAAIEAEDPFLNHTVNGIDIIFYDEYPNVIKHWEFPTDASLPRNYTPRAAVPYFQLKFPYNMIVYLSLPVLAPVILGMVYTRVRKEGQESRKRVEEIEKADSYNSKLIHAVADLERQMEDKVTDFIDIQTAQEMPSREKEEEKWWVPCSRKRDGEHAFFCSCRRKKEAIPPDTATEGGSLSSGSLLDEKKNRSGFKSFFKHNSRATTPEPSSETSSVAETDSGTKEKRKCGWSSSKKSQPKMDTPTLLDAQREMIVRLNKLTNLRKERAFYDDTRNSHASIVCRADRGFDPEAVDSVLRHWADGFVF